MFNCREKAKTADLLFQCCKQFDLMKANTICCPTSVKKGEISTH